MRKYLFTGDGFASVSTHVEREFLPLENRRVAWEMGMHFHPHQVSQINLDARGKTAAECAEFGTMLHRLGYPKEAHEAFLYGVELEPDNPLAQAFVIVGNDYLVKGVSSRMISLRLWARKFAKVENPGRFVPFANDPDPERMIRVGYLSGDFFRHSAFNTWYPVLREHDQSRFHTVGYYTNTIKDDYTVSARLACSEWRNVSALDDDALYSLIQADEIDILVDLSCHTAGNRLKCYAMKPAPIQTIGFGFVEGNGLKALDYVWRDDILLTPEERREHRLESLPIPSAFFYEAPADAPDVSYLPCAYGNPFTFGCFNKLDKINDECLVLWKEILDAVPGSRLILKDVWYNRDETRVRLAERLWRLGYKKEQIILYGESPHAQHLCAFDDVDVALDPFPHNGGTSTCEALWMGVPVVTIYGVSPPARMGAAILYRTGLEFCIANSLEGYKRIAVMLANERNALEQMRANMRARLSASVVFDVKRIVRGIEESYRWAWQQWCGKQAKARRA